MNVLLILLGCNIYSVLFNRLESTFKFIDENISMTNFSDKEPIQITWFLSGGIKNNFVGAQSEASIMKSQIDNIIDLKYNSNSTKSNYINEDLISKTKFTWDYILDENSTNTAENFIMGSQFLNTSTQSFDSIYVVTSAFHYNRAQMMLNLIDPSRNFKWILGDLEEKDSKYWELIHTNNVMADVSKAKIKFKL
jgi:hypothetical protein